MKDAKTLEDQISNQAETIRTQTELIRDFLNALDFTERENPNSPLIFHKYKTYKDVYNRADDFIKETCGER